MHQPYTTYSVVARDRETGQLGVAVQTHQMCVGSVVPWLAPGVGALATQSLANVRFGPMGLALLREGVAAPQVVDALVATDPEADRRQVAVVDARGEVGVWTGAGCIPEAGHQTGEGYSVQANMMVRPTVIPAMARAFEEAEGDLVARMMKAMWAAQREGGDIRGMQSAALRVVSGEDPSARGAQATLDLYDLRVDESEHPLEELDRLVRLRTARLLDREGHEALEQGERRRAMEKFGEAREMAPELEELGFWQAVTLADEHQDLKTAAEILDSTLAGDPLRGQWLDLIRRLQVCGLLDRAETAEEILESIGARASDEIVETDKERDG